jgi:LysM repeat protein
MKSNVLFVAVSAALLASCGGSSGKATGDTTAFKLTATNYVVTPTVPPSSTLPAGVTAAPVDPAVNPNATTYVVVKGDLPSTIAKKFKVPFQDLMNANGWTLDAKSQVPGFAVGQTIQIPAGSQVGGTASTPTVAPAPGDTGSATNTSVASSTGDTTAPKPTATTVAGACAPGEYVVLKEDTSRTKVAKKLGTTVAELDAANKDTKGYSSFYPGLKIKTPPKKGC